MNKKTRQIALALMVALGLSAAAVPVGAQNVSSIRGADV
jgi:hypothetical protein